MENVFKADIIKSLVECDLILEELENKRYENIFMGCVLLVLLFFIGLVYIHKIENKHNIRK